MVNFSENFAYVLNGWPQYNLSSIKLKETVLCNIFKSYSGAWGQGCYFLEKGKSRQKKGKNAQNIQKTGESFGIFEKGHSHGCKYRTYERPTISPNFTK